MKINEPTEIKEPSSNNKILGCQQLETLLSLDNICVCNTSHKIHVATRRQSRFNAIKIGPSRHR